MSKYIDAYFLREEIDEYYKTYKSKYMETRNPYDEGIIDALDLAEQVINRLQQERPEVDIVTEYDEQFNSDPVYGKLVNRNAGIAIARHFYELGRRTEQ